MSNAQSTTPFDDEPNVQESAYDAWRVILDPHSYSEIKLQHLINRGKDSFRYTDENGNEYIDEEEFFHVVEEFALRSMDEPDREEIIANPWIVPSEPGRLFLAYSSASLVVQDNPAFERRTNRLKLHEYVHDAFVAHVYAALDQFSDKGKLQKYAAEVVFSRNEVDERGPPPGRTVRDIVSFEDKPASAYFEIPAAHSSRYTNVDAKDGNGYAGFYLDGYLYLPFWTLTDALDRHLLDSRPGISIASYYPSLMSDYYGEEVKDNLIQSTSRITDQIEKYKQRNWTDKYLKERYYPEKLRCVLKAVYAAPDRITSMESDLDAGEIKTAIDWYCNRAEGPIEGNNDDKDSEYEADDDEYKNYKTYVRGYEQDLLHSEFDSAKSVGNFLRLFDNGKDKRYNDHEHVTINKGKYNTYELDYRDNNIKKLDIAEPSDILEFPCMQQAHEDLLEGVPSRWLLYTIARFLFSLDNDFGVDAVHELFSQYDWYDEATTEREARYEYQRGSPDDPIMPIGCNVTNDKFTGYCIGRDKCDHSLYYSVRHKDEVYDNLEDS